MTDRLNVLLVVLGGARADRISAYGYPLQTTPFLDRVAREGVRFQNVIAPSPATMPAHASLLTGLFVSAHGASDETGHLPVSHRLLSEDLKDAGYRTAAFCTNPWVSPQTGFGRGFDRFHTQRFAGRFTGRAAHYARSASDRVLGRADSGARRTNRALLPWLEQVQEPFFAFVHYDEMRLPLQPPAPYDRSFMPAGVTAARIRSVNQDGGAYLAGRATMTAEDVNIVGALYDGALRYVDLRLEEVAEALQRHDRWDRTLVVITADHGESLGEHRLLGHRFGLYDTMLRVPLILRCPGVPQGFVVDELAQVTDVVPTVLALSGVAPDPRDRPGRALIRNGQATVGPAYTISERFRGNLSAFKRQFPEFDSAPFDIREKAIRTRREKFIWHSDEANELYDLVRDPSEEHNLIEHAGHHAEALRRQLFDWFASVAQRHGELGAHEVDPSTRQEIERLGYVE